MVQIGKFNQLKILRQLDIGLILDGEKYGDILLPARYVPENFKDEKAIEVFVYPDSEDRLIATTLHPKAQVGQFALLEVVSTESIGAFLDWGLPKDLFLPFSEQSRDLNIGHKILVYIYLDNTERLCASMRIDKYVSKDTQSYEKKQPVDLIIFGKTDLGYKALINLSHMGMIFHDEIFQKIQYGQFLKGYIKNIRSDGKIDLILQKTGHQAGQDIEPLIIDQLKKHNGFLHINDKSSTDLIYDLFGVSKKKYKIALGGLYRKKIITIDDDGIRLVKK